ncbi:MAG: T9SS type A sorting domain-containing protein [Bacteroidota bacterium]
MKQKYCFVILLFALYQTLNAQVIPGSIIEEEIDTYLATPAAGSIKTVPVIVLRYLPTTDGVNLDVSKATDYWDKGEITLSDLKANIDKYLAGLKFSLEEGSKFHGYKDPGAVPYLGYKVFKFWSIYDQIPISSVYKIGEEGGYDKFAPDYFRIYNDFGLKSYIENNDIREIWIWFGQSAMPGWPSYDPAINKPENFVDYVESNMASKLTGDISNSHRYSDDIPLAEKTAVVYCHNFRRTQAEAVHNHGHQLECLYKYIAEKQDGNFNLFVHDFSGWGNDYSTLPLGRAGDCHHPPNTTIDYDYLNTTLVESDIEDWRPAGGTKKWINVNTWAGLDYAWPAGYDFPQLEESQWYIYWMQNMPGYGSDIPYGDYFMTNWWDFTADWDAGNNEGIGLYGENPPLPVELISFEAYNNESNNIITLHWCTAIETDNYGFEIERKEMEKWVKIGFLGGHGNSNCSHQYSFADHTASGTVSYRLKQIDFDGNYKYSNEVTASAASPTEFNLLGSSPNPFNHSTVLFYTVPVTGRVVFKIFNMLGQEVAAPVVADASAGIYNRLQFDASQLTSGSYFCRLEYAGEFRTVKIMLVK